MPLTKSSYSIITTPRGNGLGVFIDGRDGLLKLKDAVGVIEPLGNYLSIASISGRGLVSGGIVTWLGDLNFNISPATYYINNQFYSSPSTNVTLSDADPTNPRIDSFAVNTSGQAIVIEGIPAANPQRPSVDPETQVYLTFTKINAGATSPAGVTSTDISSWGWVNLQYGFSDDNSALNPYEGGTSLRVCNIITDPNQLFVGLGYYYQPASVDLADADNFSFAFFGDFNDNNPSITLQFNKGATASATGTQTTAQIVLSQGDYGIDFTGQTWQVISIPISDLDIQTPSDLTFNGLVISTTKGGCAQYAGIELQSGISSGQTDIDYFEFIQSDAGSMEATQPSDTFQVIGAGGLSVNITGKSIEVDGSGIVADINTDSGIRGDGTVSDPIRLGIENGNNQIIRIANENSFGFALGLDAYPSVDLTIATDNGRDMAIAPFVAQGIVRIAFSNRVHLIYINRSRNSLQSSQVAQDGNIVYNLYGGTVKNAIMGDGYIALGKITKPFVNPAIARNFCLYADDAAGAGTAAPHFVSEDGNVVILYPFTDFEAPTGTSTYATFDTATATTADAAERLKAVIDDLQAIGLLGTV